MTPRGGPDRRVTRQRSSSRHDADDGVTFVEVLVSIVLLGTAVIATLAALRSTIVATAVERDHSKAHEWLQSASEILASEDIVYLDCDTPLTGNAIAMSYEADLQTYTSVVPQDWQAGQITLVGDVLFAQASGAYAAACVDEIDRQLITVRVQDTDGDIVEEVQIVKAAP